MKVFFRVAAVLVAWGNWYLTTVGNPAFLVEYGWASAVQSLFVGAVVGLLVAEVSIRGMRPLLEGGLLARYVAMAGAVFVGGMMYGALLPISILLFSGMPSDTLGVPNLLEQILLGLGAGIFGVLGGGRSGCHGGPDPGSPLGSHTRVVHERALAQRWMLPTLRP